MFAATGTPWRALVSRGVQRNRQVAGASGWPYQHRTPLVAAPVAEGDGAPAQGAVTVGGKVHHPEPAGSGQASSAPRSTFGLDQRLALDAVFAEHLLDVPVRRPLCGGLSSSSSIGFDELLECRCPRRLEPRRHLQVAPACVAPPKRVTGVAPALAHSDLERCSVHWTRARLAPRVGMRFARAKPEDVASRGRSRWNDERRHRRTAVGAQRRGPRPPGRWRPLHSQVLQVLRAGAECSVAELSSPAVSGQIVGVELGGLVVAMTHPLLQRA